MFVGRVKRNGRIIVSNLDGAPSTSADYTRMIGEYDAQITAQKTLLATAQKQLAAANNQLSDAQQRRGSCDLDATEVAQIALLGRWGLIDEQNKCYDTNNRDQDAAKASIATAQQKIKNANAAIAALQIEKDKAVVGLREQIRAESIARTEAIKAEAGLAVAKGTVDPEVLKAKAEIEAEAGMANNKKILYAGVVLFIVLAGLAGAFVIVSKSKSA